MQIRDFCTPTKGFFDAGRSKLRILTKNFNYSLILIKAALSFENKFNEKT